MIQFLHVSIRDSAREKEKRKEDFFFSQKEVHCRSVQFSLVTNRRHLGDEESDDDTLRKNHPTFDNFKQKTKYAFFVTMKRLMQPVHTSETACTCSLCNANVRIESPIASTFKSSTSASLTGGVN
jgi:hypothetical protein